MSDIEQKGRRIRVVGVYTARDALQTGLWRSALRYLTRVPGCTVARFEPMHLDLVKSWAPDGAIVHGLSREALEVVRGICRFVVNTSGVHGSLPVPSVLPDNLQVGRMAGEYMLMKGYREFAYIGPQTDYSAKRLAGYQEAIWKVLPGVEVRQGPRVTADEPKPGQLTPFLAWFDSLPRGTALFAADDALAFNATEAVRGQNWEVLSRVGLISGHDRDTPSNPLLTGVRMPEDRWGYEAARMVVDMLRGEREVTRDLLLPPLGVIERESTTGVATEDRYLLEAVRFIREHATETIGVEDVARAVSLGRRALERRFEKYLGRTVLKEIQRMHVEHAKSLLLDTDMSVYAVALESGLTDEKHLRRVMREFAGITPGEFRRMHRITK